MGGGVVKKKAPHIVISGITLMRFHVTNYYKWWLKCYEFKFKIGDTSVLLCTGKFIPVKMWLDLEVGSSSVSIEHVFDNLKRKKYKIMLIYILELITSRHVMNL